MSAETTFDILNGPASAAEVARPEPEPRRFSVGFWVGAVLSVAVVVAGVVVSVNEPTWTAMSLLGVLIGCTIASLIGRAVTARMQRKRTWLESEIEIAWFRSLNASKASDEFDQPITEIHDLSEYERGFRDGYKRGLADA